MAKRVFFFFFCSVVAEEMKLFLLIFPKGRSVHGGWFVLAKSFIPSLEVRGVVCIIEERKRK